MAAKRGRPSDFNDKVAERIINMAKSGKTDQQIAHAIGTSVTTLKNWKGQHPDFLAALKDAKEVADDLVIASLFQRAVGYKAPALKIFCTKAGVIVTRKYVEHYAPDTTACIFWLKNRQKDKWRDRIEKYDAEELAIKSMTEDEQLDALLANPNIVKKIKERLK